MLHVLGMGACHPSNVIDNQFLEDLDIDSSADWILEKIGIETRLSTLPLDYIRETKNRDPRQALEVMEMTPTEMGAKASRAAAERAGIAIEEIGLVISNCCAPLQSVPAESQRIACALNLKVPAYDVFSACPAFALHIDLLNSFREEKLPDYVLCVCTAALTQKVDYNNRSDSAIWGDGAAAWIVSAKHPGKLRVVDSFFDANPRRCKTVVIDTYGFFTQDGRAVRDFSVRQTVKMIKALERTHEVDWHRDIFVGHQANATMLEQVTRNRKIPDSNHWSNVRTVGNQAAAGAPAVLAGHWDQINPGSNIIVAVVGAGLSWGSAMFTAV